MKKTHSNSETKRIRRIMMFKFYSLSCLTMLIIVDNIGIINSISIPIQTVNKVQESNINTSANNFSTGNSGNNNNLLNMNEPEGSPPFAIDFPKVIQDAKIYANTVQKDGLRIYKLIMDKVHAHPENNPNPEAVKQQVMSDSQYFAKHINMFIQRLHKEGSTFAGASYN